MCNKCQAAYLNLMEWGIRMTRDQTFSIYQLLRKAHTTTIQRRRFTEAAGDFSRTCFVMKKPMEEPVLVRKPVSDGVLERVNRRRRGKHGWHSLIWNDSWYWMVVAWTYLVHLRAGGDPVVSWKRREGRSRGRSAKCEDRSLSFRQPAS